MKKRLRRASEPDRDGAGSEESNEWVRRTLEDLGLLIFRVDLAHRLCERIMTEGLMTSVYDWYDDLARIHKVLSEVDSLMRSVRNGATPNDQAGKHRRP